jgi:hypothetical protein
VSFPFVAVLFWIPRVLLDFAGSYALASLEPACLRSSALAAFSFEFQ